MFLVLNSDVTKSIDMYIKSTQFNQQNKLIICQPCLFINARTTWKISRWLTKMTKTLHRVEYNNIKVFKFEAQSIEYFNHYFTKQNLSDPPHGHYELQQQYEEKC